MIKVKQIDNAELSAFIAGISTGSPLNEALLNYFRNSGWLGATPLYITGSDQTVFGLKSFNQEPLIPTGGANQSGAASKLYVQDKIFAQINSYSGWASGEYVSRSLSQTVGGIKTFSSNAFVPFATDLGHATNLQNLMDVSGILRTGLNNVQIQGVIFDYGAQHITGQKTFDVSPLVVVPTNESGAVPLSMLTGLSINSAVSRTGLNEDVSGIKRFVQSPLVPIAVSSNQAINKTQLDAAINGVSVGTGSIQGVSSVNAQSGIVLIDGAAGISIVSCSGIIYVSGNAQNTSLYSVSIPLTVGATGINFSYSPVFSIEPNVVGTLKFAGNTGLQFIDEVIVNSNSGGFNVSFSTGIPTTGYFYNFSAIPVNENSGFLGVQGERGFPAYNFKQRGRWQAGLSYNPYEVVFTTPNFVSYWTTGIHISDSFNAPSGTGTSYWQILSSGQQGPTGAFIYQGIHNTGVAYNFRDTVIFDGSTYVYTGSSPASGYTPEGLTGNWGLVAAKAPLGYFINSGILTGSFISCSFFLSPATTTGLDLYEVISPNNFFCTGFAVMASVTGSGPTNGGILTGRIYTKDLTNTKTIFQNFTFNSGAISYISGNFSHPVTGYHRIGIDLRNSLSGLDKLSIGVFGFGTV